MLLCFAIACTNSEEPEAATEEMNIPPPPPPVALKDISLENTTYVVNGKEVSKGFVDHLKPEIIKTANIVKGVQGNIIEIVTKDFNTKEKVSFEDSRKLIIVDGEKMSDDFKISSIGKENIKSVNIIGVEEMIKEYTDGDYDRVVLIETK